jgi:hypothetical protein
MGVILPQNCENMAKIIMYIKTLAKIWQLFGEILLQFAKIGRK